MLSVLSGARKSLTSAVLVLSSLLLAACVSGAPSVTGPGLGENVPVALLVPGGSGQAGDDLLSKGLENAARLAIADLGGNSITLKVYNTAGQPAQAAAMATVWA